MFVLKGFGDKLSSKSFYLLPNFMNKNFANFLLFLCVVFSFSTFSDAQSSQLGTKNEDVSKANKKLNILFKPVPQLTEEQKKDNIEVQGTVTLRVEFLVDGQIGKVLPIVFLPYGLTENAIEAAKKIKFEPEIKNGLSITVFKPIQYSFQFGWNSDSQKNAEAQKDEKAEAILKRAVEKLGGEKYLQVKSIVGRGKFSLLRDNAIISFQNFVDVIVFPDKERTEFKSSASKIVQTNVGGGGWIFDGDAQTINEQSKEQIEGFKRGIRTSLDNLLRGSWRGKAALTYGGRRPAGLGRRNEVVKLTFDDGFAVEFEFADDGLPMKALFKRLNADNEEIKEEDRYAQFVDVQGIKMPFIIDHFSDRQQTSRINYESVEFNKPIPDSIFNKPKSAKELKKDLKL